MQKLLPEIKRMLESGMSQGKVANLGLFKRLLSGGGFLFP